MKDNNIKIFWPVEQNQAISDSPQKYVCKYKNIKTPEL